MRISGEATAGVRVKEVEEVGEEVDEVAVAATMAPTEAFEVDVVEEAREEVTIQMLRRNPRPYPPLHRDTRRLAILQSNMPVRRESCTMEATTGSTSNKGHHRSNNISN